KLMAVETHQGTLAEAKPLERIQSMVLPMLKQPPPPTQPVMGFFTDTSLCIGCKACEVACKQWNQLPAKDPVWTGSSYDNTGGLSAIAWRHVHFIEEVGDPVWGTGKDRPSLPLLQGEGNRVGAGGRGVGGTGVGGTGVGGTGVI